MEKPLPNITVLIPTWNRAEVLRQTLEGLTRVDRSGLDCDIIIINNNSTDNTDEVVNEYRDRLPLSLLKETRPGKNCALNKALRECPLKEVIVFADDDITPAPNWLQSIIASTIKWPDMAVFGGRVVVGWPAEKQPAWVEADWIQAIGCGRHHYAEKETFYQPPACPFGANFWVRRSVFQKNPLFNESLSPRPKNYIMGGETSFLMGLQRENFKIIYCPDVVVQHRIQEKDCSISVLQNRGFKFGRRQAWLHGWRRHQIFTRNKALWWLIMALDYAYAALRYWAWAICPDVKKKCEGTVKCMIRMGHISESLRLARQRFKSGGGTAEFGVPGLESSTLH